MSEDTIIASADAVAESYAAQQRTNPNADVRPSEIDPVRADELDSIFNEATKSEPASDPMADAKRESGIKDEKPADEVVSTETEEKPADSKPVDAPAAEEKKKGLLDSILEDKKDDQTAEAKKDPYDEVKLRADASPKTRETFEALKNTAREREKAAFEKTAALEKTVSELSEKLKGTEGKTATPEIENELKELRAYRAQFDTENDPEFKSKYDTKLNSNYDTVYSKLKEHGLKDEVLNQLKAMSPAERDQNIENFLTKIPTASRRLIEAKLVENITVSEQRRSELNSVREKADQILAERAKAPVESAQKLETEITGHLRPVLGKIDWIQIKDVPTSASPNEKATIEKSNEFAAYAQELLKNAIIDQSPRARAEAALAVPFAHHFKAQATALSAEVAALKKELDGIRRASATSRTARTSANPNPTTVSAPKKDASSEDSLDELFKEAGGQL
jgi:hypothetical protein